MTTPSVSTRDELVLPARGDSVRIVPLHVPDDLLSPIDKAAPATPAKLTYRGGPLLTNVKVFTVFWGTAWQAQPLSDTAQKLNAFFDFILTSSLLDQLAEYSVAGKKIEHGSRIGSAVVTAPNPRHVVSDHAIQHMLHQELATERRVFLKRTPTRCTSFTCRPTCASPRAVVGRARRSVATTTPSTVKSSTRRCPTQDASAAPATSRRSTP